MSELIKNKLWFYGTSKIISSDSPAALVVDAAALITQEELICSDILSNIVTLEKLINIEGFSSYTKIDCISFMFC